MIIQRLFCMQIILVLAPYLTTPAFSEEADYIVSPKDFACVADNIKNYISRYSDHKAIPIGRCPTIPGSGEPIDEQIADGPEFVIKESEFDGIVFAGPEQLSCWFSPYPENFTAAKLFIGSCRVEFEIP